MGNGLLRKQSKSISFTIWNVFWGGYLGHYAAFLTKYWYLTVYYVIPWLLFPPTGWLVDKKNKFALPTVNISTGNHDSIWITESLDVGKTFIALF